MSRSRWGIGLAVLGVVAALGAVIVGAPSGAQASPAQQDDRAALLAQIDAAEQRWSSQGIGSYRIEVRRVNSIWHAQWNTVVVKDGQVAEQSSRCTRAPAESQHCRLQPFDAAQYTVPGLFATARAIVQDADPDAMIRIAFDDAAGYPRSIFTDRPQVTDDDQGWGVETLTPL
jgi:hypothetical protein